MDIVPDLVWYASYGSNLSLNRFMCYIVGGRPSGSTHSHQGCTDKTPPLNDRNLVIPHKLYFSKNFPNWENKGCAFVKAQTNPKVVTLGRMYLLNPTQFIQVIRQESGFEPSDPHLEINLTKAMRNGQYMVEPPHFARNYGRVMYLGDDEGFPIFTFTAKWNDDEIVLNPPGERYLNTIRTGLKEAYGISDDEIERYLQHAEGYLPGKKRTK